MDPLAFHTLMDFFLWFYAALFMSSNKAKLIRVTKAVLVSKIYEYLLIVISCNSAVFPAND